jgi:hypothetical protein
LAVSPAVEFFDSSGLVCPTRRTNNSRGPFHLIRQKSFCFTYVCEQKVMIMPKRS